MKSPMVRGALIVLVLLLAIYLFQPGARKAKLSSVKLVLLIVADQFPQEYLQRFSPVLSGGLGRLAREGARFEQARFQHADTATGPGHAAIVTGRHPSGHGIIGNSWVDRQTGAQVYCVDDPQYRRSPQLMKTSTLSEWLKGSSRRSKVFSLSGKDRAAILLGGRDADAAIWYDRQTGDFLTSDYYPSRSPGRWYSKDGWLANFNTQHNIDRWFGALWEALPVEPSLLERMGIAKLDEGVFPREFPYSFGSAKLYPGESYYKEIYNSPFLDSYTAELAAKVVLEEELGKDDAPDVLALSFSALDAVGHQFGPHSREVLDTVLRLDQTLENLFTLLDEKVGMEHVLVVFTSDHGVQRLPEFELLQGNTAAYRQRPEDVVCVQRLFHVLQQRFGLSELFLSSFVLDREGLRQHQLDSREVERFVASSLESCAAIEKVWTYSDLLGDGPEDNAFYFEQFKNGFDPQRSPDFAVLRREHYLQDSGKGTNHGSPYTYDAHVPMIFMHQDIQAVRLNNPVAVVDLAPTLASLLGLRPAKELDGVDRSQELLKDD